jgi:hypothetical protein
MLQVLKTIHCFTNGNMARDAVERCMRVSKAMEFSQENHTIFFVLPFVIKHIFESLTQ